ncbi:unnamed protein product [Coregonus sp. 'balchen']|nr:unnamed protein product [Coregonus sp. 'balchen']
MNNMYRWSLFALLFVTCMEVSIQKKTKQGPQTLSRALKKAFAADKAIQELAQEDFVMLNVMHETTDTNLAPDGHYVPRIIFVDPSMTVRADLVGKYGNRMYTYEPSDVPYLAENMKKAKRLLHTEL